MNKSKVKEVYLLFINQLKALSNKDKIDKIEGYLKHKVKSRGNTNPSINEAFKITKSTNEYKELHYEDKFNIAIELLSSEFFEDKYTSSLILYDIRKYIDFKKINILKTSYAENVNEWATADTIASKVTKQYSMISKEACEEIAEWRYDKNMWIRRMSCVSFVTRVKHGNNPPNFEGFMELMIEICKENIKSKERFNQLAVGWLLREISLVRKMDFDIFLTENKKLFSREALRYATEKLSNNDKEKYLS